MKKIFLWALGLIFLGIIGNSISPSSAVQGIQTTPTPTIAIPTVAPTATPTLIPAFTPSPTKAPTLTPTTAPQSSGLSNDNYYTNVDGNQVHSPAYSDTTPSGATAICADGTYSFSQNRRGTCSGHGGVAQWL